MPQQTEVVGSPRYGHRYNAEEDSLLREHYASRGQAWCADQLGRTLASVRERVQLIGVAAVVQFTPQDDDRIRREYQVFRQAGKLRNLAAAMGRDRFSLCSRARKLGLTSYSHSKPYMAKWKYMSEDAARVVWESFKASSLGLGQYCRKHGMDDLGFAKTMKKYFADEWDSAIELKVPLQSLYRVGRALEYRVRDQLRAAGFFVLRSPASRSPIDLVAIRPGRVVFVQCKRGGLCGVAEWNEFFDLCVSVGAEPILASQPTGRGTVYHLMTGRKDGSKRPQPLTPWTFPTQEAQ